MTGLPFEQQFLLGLQAVALVSLCLRLWTTGLYRRYAAFFSFLLLEFTQVAILPFLAPNRIAYRNTWMVTEGLIVGACALVVLETYTSIFRDFAGIASVARRYIKISLGAAVFVSLVLVSLEKTPSTIPQYFLVCDRVTVSSLLFLVLSALVFLVYYPIPLNRNAMLYSIGFTLYLLARSTAFFIANLKYSSWSRVAGEAPLAVSTACLLFWLFTLNQKGETKSVVVGHQWNPSNEKRLLSQLRQINESLLRVSKR